MSGLSSERPQGGGVNQRKIVGVYTCVRMRFRLVLPVTLGIVSVALIIWYMYGLRVIRDGGGVIAGLRLNTGEKETDVPF